MSHTLSDVGTNNAHPFGELCAKQLNERPNVRDGWKAETLAQSPCGGSHQTPQSDPEKGRPVADEADTADKAGMTVSSLASSKIIVSVILSFALFIGAIIAQNFWLSLGLGLAGLLTFAYAVFVLRESRKSLADKKSKP